MDGVPDYPIDHIENELPEIIPWQPDPKLWDSRGRFFPDVHRDFQVVKEALEPKYCTEILVKAIGNVLSKNKMLETGCCGNPVQNMAVLARHTSMDISVVKSALLYGDMDGQPVYVRHSLRRYVERVALELKKHHNLSDESYVLLNTNIGMYYFPVIEVFQEDTFVRDDDSLECFAVSSLMQTKFLVHMIERWMSRLNCNWQKAVELYVQFVFPDGSNVHKLATKYHPYDVQRQMLQEKHRVVAITEAIIKSYNHLQDSGHAVN